MPNQIVNYRRRYNPIPYNTMFRAAKAATERIKSGNTESRTFRKMIPQIPKKNNRTVTTGSTPKTVIGSYSGGNDFTRTKRVIRSKRPKSTKAKVAKNSMLIKHLMTNEIYRFQNLSNYDTDVGGIIIRNSRNTTTGEVTSPIHIYDISAFNNESTQTCGYRLGWASTATNAVYNRTALDGQNSDGSSLSAATWMTEKNSTQTPFPAARNALHNWSDIRFNFYGPRKRTTYFEVMFILIKDEFADLIQGATSNISGKLLLQYLERPLIYNNLQTDVGGEASKMFKVVKRFRYYISASQSTDVDTTVGKVKEAKIFMRHDRLRGYDWQHHGLSASDVIPHGDDDGLDYVRDDDVHNIAAPNKRLYMVVRAFSPERALTSSLDPNVDSNRDPSYDILIRNSFSFVRSNNS